MTALPDGVDPARERRRGAAGSDPTVRSCSTEWTAVQTARVDTYTHGHAEPVLQSHRWRTAENSAGYLLPSAAPGLDLLDVGCGPGTITVDLAAPRGAGPRARHRRLGRRRSTRRGPRRARGRWTSSSRSATSTRSQADDDSFDVVHAHQVLQHLDRPGRRAAGDGPRVPPGRAWSPSATSTTARSLVPGRRRARPVAGPVPPGGAPQRGRARRRPPAAGVGARGGAARRRRHHVSWCYASPAERRVVGRLVGRPGDGVVVRRAGGGLRARDAGRPGGDRRRVAALAATPTTAGSACCTANCSSAPEGPFMAMNAPRARRQPWRAALAWTAVLTYCARPGAISS